MVTKGHNTSAQSASSQPDRRKLEIKSWVQLHHLELMKSCGRSVARSIAKGTSHVTARAEGHAH